MNDVTKESAAKQDSLGCKSCGATLYFEPGTHSLVCQYCEATNEIDQPEVVILETKEFHAFNEKVKETTEVKREATLVKCSSCGASTTLPPEVTSEKCPFCATPISSNDKDVQEVLQPDYIIPFIVNEESARENFMNWVGKSWFAPSDVVSRVESSSGTKLQGIYLPYWSYDADTITDYTGERGDHYYETERYTQDGEVKERRVQKTRWSYASGRVGYSFNDVLVAASHSLPQETAIELEPWAIDKVVKYDEKYLRGFRSETYQIDTEEGLGFAKQRMQKVIEGLIRSDIGGDEQRIDNTASEYNDLGIKYISMPVWISSYKYKEKVYQFVVNACTGEVVGERPTSALKIALVVIAVLAVIAIIIYFASQS